MPMSGTRCSPGPKPRWRWQWPTWCRPNGGATRGFGPGLAAYTPDMAARESGVPAATIARLAREFAAEQPSLAVAGGIATQHSGAIELCAAVNLLNFVAG